MAALEHEVGRHGETVAAGALPLDRREGIAGFAGMANPAAKARRVGKIADGPGIRRTAFIIAMVEQNGVARRLGMDEAIPVAGDRFPSRARPEISLDLGFLVRGKPMQRTAGCARELLIAG
jgi:hypothetical protein